MKESPERPNAIYQTYPHWDMSAPALPPRSRLFRLEPLGFGTTKIESLSSYLNRLAESHCVSPHSLLCKVVFPSVREGISHYSHTFGYQAIQVNGMGTIADITATGLERLTLRQDLLFMTTMPWKNILSPFYLLRPYKAWCVTCYDEQLRNGETLYEPLIWAIKAISICPIHYERLSQICPHCNRSVPILSVFSRVGYCSRCRRWLGTSAITTETEKSDVQSVSDSELTQQLPIIHSISELLSRAPSLASLPSNQSFIANLTKYIEKHARNNINLFSDLVEIWSGTIRRLLLGKVKPRLEMLWRICSRLNISLLDLLVGAGNEEMLERRHLIFGRDIPLPKEITPWEKVESNLQISLQECPPPSMEAVARRMGYHPPKVKRHFPELCEQIISRYKEYLKTKHPPSKEIRKALRAALREQPPPSLQRVLRRLGCRDTGYYYYDHYRDLCFAVAKRYKDFRNKPFNKGIDHDQLKAALAEVPPPSFSEVARRLGHSREFVHRKFPELSKAVTSRYLYHQAALRKERDERLRQETREAISCIMALGLYVSEARVRDYVKSRLPHLGRSSIFKQALHQIKSEMGIIQVKRPVAI
jgi:transcriptional regulator with XRE-family HTH domain/AcrR family transcriptional regulator